MRFLSAILIVILLFPACQRKSHIEDDYASALSLFRNPTADYSTAPFWVWNDRVTHQKIDEQLMNYKDIGIMQVIIHPRPGLITPYLTDEWFELIKYAINKAKTMGMKVFLYDENSYPSGFAGGNVPAQMPEARAAMIQRIITTRPDTLRLKTIALFRQSGQKYFLVDSVIPAANDVVYHSFVILPAYPSGWHGGFTYVDIMQKKVTEKFLELTIGGYKKVIGDEFGKTVTGIFTDEPNISGVWGKDLLNYTPALFDAFHKKYNYDLKPVLPSLIDETGNWRKIRHDYYSVLLDLFIGNWAIPYSQYCEQNNLRMTGHYWDHEWPRPAGVPDNMALDAYSQIPGIDVLMNHWYGGYSGQFGNNRMVRELGSLANQLDRKRTLSETYGASGWDLTFNDMKRIGDWEYALGVNLMNQHLSYMSLLGARKRDHPLSFSWADPWWQDYRLMNDYFSRLSVAMSLGRQENKVLVIEPTTSAWMYYSINWSPDFKKENGWKEGNFGGIIASFHAFVDSLESWQVEYDLGCEDIIKKHGEVGRGKLIVGHSEYSLVILPPLLENLDSATAELLEKYLRKGGQVLSTTNLPAYIEGKSTGKIMNMAASYSKKWTKVREIKELDIARLLQPIGHYQMAQPSCFVFHHCRILADAKLVFLANVHDKKYAKGNFSIDGGSAERWDPFTGNMESYPYSSRDKQISMDYTLPPGGSLLLCIKPEKKPSVNPVKTKENIVSFPDKLRIECSGPNVLIIDYCDLKLKEKKLKDIYFYQANTEVYRSYGFDRDPWDNSVQYKSAILERDTFGTNTGFSADYWFDLEKGVNKAGLKLVSERPRIFKVMINDMPVKPIPGEYWLDREFAVYAIDSLVKTGKNKITLTSYPMSVFSELEPVYILGDFSLAPKKPGFSLKPRRKLEPGAWNEQGMQLYGDRVSYSHTIIIEKPDGKYKVRLGKWAGACADVFVNGKKAGIIAFSPYEMDVTSLIKPGSNEVKVVVYGTLRNTLGPHHVSTSGSTWPAMFQYIEKGKTLAGDSYISYPYGLFEDFGLFNER